MIFVTSLWRGVLVYAKNPTLPFKVLLMVLVATKKSL
uniref:Uncharacterized protein n=1 Tax=Lepeophtheirus salmonis TaxID=72036 RepID=A0A0K2T685_LEPSM